MKARKEEKLGLGIILSAFPLSKEPSLTAVGLGAGGGGSSLSISAL